MNSTTSASVEGVVPSLDIIIGTDRLSVDAPGTWWESVGVRVTEGKITVKVSRKSRGNRFWFELARGSS